MTSSASADKSSFFSSFPSFTLFHRFLESFKNFFFVESLVHSQSKYHCAAAISLHPCFRLNYSRSITDVGFSLNEICKTKIASKSLWLLVTSLVSNGRHIPRRKQGVDFGHNIVEILMSPSRLFACNFLLFRTNYHLEDRFSTSKRLDCMLRPNC